MDEFLKTFPWESEEQKKGYLSLVLFLNGFFKKAPNTMENKVLAISSFFIQKDHESNEWWTEMIGNQVKELQDQIRKLQKLVVKQNGELAVLKSQVAILRGEFG